jgi:hypothetical protein
VYNSVTEVEDILKWCRRGLNRGNKILREMIAKTK